MEKAFTNRNNKPAGNILRNLFPLMVLCILLAIPHTEAAAQGRRSITGSVKDMAGEPLPGATVLEKGTPNGTTTDTKGNFSLSVAPGATLEFIYLGYITETVESGNSTVINAVLKDDLTEMETVVVIGYGEVKKTDLTGSVTNVKMTDIADVPVLSIDQALQGRIAGADIMSTTGEPGAATSIRIRGTRSITAGNEPLIVVDGVLDAVSDLNDINPADVAAISVLKDASSTAIYGSRGANGVIIVTTKSGVKGRPVVTIRSDVGFSELPKGLDIMNATEFALYRNDYAYFATTDNYGEIGEGTPLSKYPYPNPYGMGEGTDWIKEITRRAPYQNYSASVAGGSEKTSYFGSFGYSNNQGIIRNSGLERLTGRFNIDHEFAKWIKLGMRLSYTYRDQKKNTADISGSSWWSAAMYLSPTMKPNTNFNELWYGGQRFNSPLAHIELRDDLTKGQTMNDALYIEIEPIKGLKIKDQGSLYTYHRHDYGYSPSNMPATESGAGGTASRTEYRENSLMNELTIQYTKTFGEDHNMDLLVGHSYQVKKYENLAMSGKGFLVDANRWNSMQSIMDRENLSPSSSFSKIQKESFIFRANYNYKQRYYLTLTGRMDGGSNFAANRKRNIFPSGALKWNIQNEEFMKNVKWIDEFAIRASYGRTGNDAISAYRSLERMNSTSSGALFDESYETAYYRSQIANPDLTWETTDMYNIALDLSFLGGRIGVTGEVYYSDTRDLLLNLQLPTQTGYGSRLSNIGRTTNKGVELTINSYNIVTPKFSWSTMLTLSHNRQNVDNIGSEDRVEVYTSHTSGYMMYGYVAGYPLNALWGFKYGGTWKSQEEIDRNNVTRTYVSVGNPQKVPGGPRYLDIDHNGVINQDDIVYLGNADPVLYGGFQNNFTYKRLSFSIYFNYSIGGKIYNVSEQFMGNNSPYTNQYRYMLDSWHPVRNPESDIPRGATLDNIVSDRFVHDASFVRLKNISIGYTFDLRKLTRNTVRDITLNLSGDNIYLWKKYNGFDPEVSTSSGNSALRRLDAGAYPKSRTITFSAQVKF